jgi:hypothetical protein
MLGDFSREAASEQERTVYAGTEGEEEQVHLLRSQIVTDPRHRDPVTLQNALTRNANLPSGTSFFTMLPASILMMCRLLEVDSPLLAEDFSTIPTLALSLLILFKGKLAHS